MICHIYEQQWRGQDFSMGNGGLATLGDFLQFFNNNNAFLCIFQPK